MNVINVYRAVVLVLLSTAVLGLWRQAAFDPLLPAPIGRDPFSRLGAIEDALRLQSMALGQALGKAVPIQLAEGSERTLVALEQVVTTPASWPNSAEEVRAMNDRLLELVKPLPPWAQDSMLTRLLPLKWSIHALWILRSDIPTARDELENFDANVQAHLDSLPDGVTPPLQAALQQHATVVRARLRTATLAEANSTLAAKPAADREDDRRLEKIAALLGTLTGPEDDASRKLRKDLELLALKQSADKTFRDVQAHRTLATKSTDPALADHALRQARLALMDLRMRMAALPPTQAGELNAVAKKAHDETKAIDDDLRNRNAERMRRYQVDVLNAVKQVKLIGVEGLVDLDGSKKKTLASQLIALAWVDRSLLDPAVAEWFQGVYAEAFLQLDKARREQVVEAFAKTPKRGID